MTASVPFDLVKWNANACGCRCIIRQVFRKQARVIRDEDFYYKYVGRYRGWHDQPGATNTAMQIAIAVEEGLATDADTFIDPVRLLKECQRKDCSGVLVHTERMADEKDNETLRPLRHVMLALNLSASGILVWNPQEKGTAKEEEIPWVFWFHGMMRATVLYREP